MTKIFKSEEEWKKELSDEQYHILREKGTEKPWTGILFDSKDKGIYQCVACGNDLYSSEDKYDSGSGWPSFHKTISHNSVELKKDISLGMERMEVKCAACEGHLGHVFPDGPQPTGKRFCMNSKALNFRKKED